MDDDDAPIGSLVIKRRLDTAAASDEPNAKKIANGEGSSVASSSSVVGIASAGAAPLLSSLNDDEELPEWWDDNVSVVILMERRNKHLKEQAAIRLKVLEEERKKQGESRALQSKGSNEKKEARGKKEALNVSGSDKGRPLGDNRAADYYETMKGQVVQSLMVRWWYAYEWPTKDEVGDPPSGYEEMEGFKGIFVSMNLDSLGQVLDLRDKVNCPSLKQLSKRSCKELQELCLKALRNQIVAVKEAEGDECALAAELKKKIKVIERIDAEAAEKEIRKAGEKFDF